MTMEGSKDSWPPLVPMGSLPLLPETGLPRYQEYVALCSTHGPSARTPYGHFRACESTAV